MIVHAWCGHTCEDSKKLQVKCWISIIEPWEQHEIKWAKDLSNTHWNGRFWRYFLYVHVFLAEHGGKARSLHSRIGTYSVGYGIVQTSLKHQTSQCVDEFQYTCNDLPNHKPVKSAGCPRAREGCFCGLSWSQDEMCPSVWHTRSSCLCKGLVSWDSRVPYFLQTKPYIQ